MNDLFQCVPFEVWEVLDHPSTSMGMSSMAELHQTTSPMGSGVALRKLEIGLWMLFAATQPGHRFDGVMASDVRAGFC